MSQSGAAVCGNVAPADDSEIRVQPQPVRSALWMVGIIVVVLISFAPVWNCEFVNWDDDRNFIDNVQFRGLSLTHLRWMFTTFHFGPYQPLSWVTLGADYLLWGMQPRGYHVTNLVVHTANALLVYALALALLRRAAPLRGTSVNVTGHGVKLSIAATVAALCFAIHPLRVESVAWVTERRDVLSGFFLLLTLLAYLRMVDARPGGAWRKWLSLSLGCFALSLLSKAAGMTLPVVLLALDVYPLQRLAVGRDTPRRIIVEKLPFVVLGGVAMVLAAWGQFAMGEMRTLGQHGITARVMQAAYALMFYLWKTVLPLRLAPVYPLRPDINPLAPLYLLCALAVAAVSLLLLRMRKRWPWVWAAWIWYVVILSPVLGFVQSGPQIVTLHFTYLACLPWALLAGAAVNRFPSCRRPVVAAMIVAGLVTLSALTFQQTRVWTNGTTLWDHALRLDPLNEVANLNRGWLQMQRGDLDGAAAYFETALRANPRFADAYRNRGFLRHKRGDLQGAIADYTTSMEIDPTPEAYFNRGVARHGLGDDDGALADYTVALQTAAPNPNTYSNRGYLRHRRGDLTGAIADYTAALQIAPTLTVTYFNRGLARQALGDTDGAIADYTVAVQAPVPNPQAYTNRAHLRRERGDLSGAIEDFEKALQVAPSGWSNRAQAEADLRDTRAQQGS